MRVRSPVARGLLRAALAASTLALASALAGCDLQAGDATRATLTYTEDARLAYGEAMESFRSKDWEAAKALFQEVRKRFPYTRYARLAELRIADADFEQDKYSDAISGYREFIQNNRADPLVEYARFRIVKALFQDVDTTFLLPPLEERDQATTNEAYKEAKRFVAEYPRSRYREEIDYILEMATQRLVRHELYVARYYLKRDVFEASVARVDYALKAFPGSALDAEALVLKGEALLKMHRWQDAREVFTRVVRDYGGPFGEVAKSFLDQMARDEPRRPPPAPPPAKGAGGAPRASR